MMSSQYLAIVLLSIISLASSRDLSPEIIETRALTVFNDSNLVENIHCSGLYTCDDFTLFYIYAFAARFPPSGAGGYITDEPQFACSYVEPPENNTVEWAALVYYSSMSTSCDCSYEEKILNVQAAGYTIALLMEKNNCTDNSNTIGNNDTNVTNITIPAVLLSETVGLLLLNYSSPTDAEPTGFVFVEAYYGEDQTIIALIVIGSIFGGILLIFIVLGVCASFCAAIESCYEYIKDMECTCPRCFDCIEDVECTCHRTARSETHETYSARSEDEPKPSDDTDSVDSETKQPTSAQAVHVSIPLQEINSYKQQSRVHETASQPATRTNGDTEIASF